MGEFFRGWRRKVGVVTLVMALVAMVGWIRSGFVDEWVAVCLGERTLFVLVSTWRGLSLESWPGMPPDSPPFLWRSNQHNPSDGLTPDDGQLRIPYCFIVIPLTLLSAFLLLTKPRKSIQKKTDEPIPEKAA